MKYLTEFSGRPVTDVPSSRWIFERIEEWAGSPNRFAFAIDHQDRVEQYSYAEVLAESARIAAVLGKNGIVAGDRVGILMENIPQWVFVLLGAMSAGAVTVPLATALQESSLRCIVEHAGCSVVFADPPNWDKAVSLGVPVIGALFDRRASRAETGSARLSAISEISGDENALIIYTSGTTGDPKGVQLTTNNLIHELRGVIELLEISSEHRILSVLPFSHVLPLIANGLGPLCVGAGVVFLSSVSPQRVIEAFHRHRITLFICVPQFFYLLHRRIFAQIAEQPLPMRMLFHWMLAISRRLKNPAISRKLFSKVHKAIGPDLRLLASGGSRFDTRIAQDLHDLGYTMLQAYGLTETTAAATATPVRENRVGTAGKPVPGATVRVNSPNEEGVGEIWIRGPIVMKGYYKDEENTAEAIHDGWLRTGDLGFIYPDGNLVITGRTKDVIVLANGKNVYPEEVEAHYSQSPYIKEMCVLGVTETGEAPASEKLHAIIVPDMDEFRRRSQTAILEMIRFETENLSKQLPSYQRLHSISIRNEPLPRTVTRKLKRFEIQGEEEQRQKAAPERAAHGDHPRFREGAGAVVAELIRKAKPDSGPLDPSLHIELDLGFDSLARVELLGEAEARLGAHVEERQVAQIFTVGEFIDALERSNRAESMLGRGWGEILDVSPADKVHGHYIFKKRRLLNPLWLVLMRLTKLFTRLAFGLRYSGIEKLPATLPFILCPNHESFLDGFLLLSIMPRRVIYNVFILGYSDYWADPISRRLAEFCNVVAIDPNVNLVRAMQVGAVGLRHNKVLLVFPEGTRSIDGHVAEFKKGAAILSYELGVPLVPVGIHGTFEAWPRGGPFTFHPVEFVIGDPIDPRDFKDAADPYAAITEKLRKDVRILSSDI